MSRFVARVGALAHSGAQETLLNWTTAGIFRLFQVNIDWILARTKQSGDLTKLLDPTNGLATGTEPFSTASFSWRLSSN